MRSCALIGAVVGAGVVVGLAVVGATPAPAAQGALGDAELKAAVSGKTVKIDTPLGLPLTVNYGANGMMTGTVGAALAVYLGSAKDRGRWSVRNGKLCQKWFKWLSGEQSCLTLRQDGLKIFWRSDEGKTGTAMIEPGPPELDGATASALGAPLPSPTETVATSEALASTPDVPAALPKAADSEPEPAPVVRDAPGKPVALASLAAVPVPVPATRPSRGAPTARLPAERDPFAVADPQPMRLAADLAAIAAIEHRWCHTNPFGVGVLSMSVAGSLHASFEPSLLQITAEQAYPDDLPLYDGACLTLTPALLPVAASLTP